MPTPPSPPPSAAVACCWELSQFFTLAEADSPFPEDEDDLFCFMVRLAQCAPLDCSAPTHALWGPKAFSGATVRALWVRHIALLSEVPVPPYVDNHRRRSRRGAATTTWRSAGLRWTQCRGSGATPRACPQMRHSSGT